MVPLVTEQSCISGKILGRSLRKYDLHTKMLLGAQIKKEKNVKIKSKKVANAFPLVTFQNKMQKYLKMLYI